MPRNTKKNQERSKKIPISDTESNNTSDEPLEKVIHPEESGSYRLHIEAGGSPVRKKPVKKTKEKNIRNKTKKTLKSGQIQMKQELSESQKNKKRILRQIWNFLEWIAISALIFMALFFIMNFSSYSMLIKSKIDQITGEFTLDPYIERIAETEGGTVEQEPLPLTESKDFKQQIPPLDLEVAPPDDRIIIPRINKNVPVVQVSSENLIKRDWNALEADIQEALKGGVVHYPGTAQAGDRGNVVITGHSSYFPWDPGRFKDVFALLHEVIIGDQIVLYHDQKKYNYTVYDTQVVTPDQVNVLTQEGEDRLTLITCTPVGTNLKRLVVFASPDY